MGIRDSFFFQAEDGIRDLVRSRGLGDVYKRQLRDEGRPVTNDKLLAYSYILTHEGYPCVFWKDYSVSYTHLTLPTSDLV